MEIRVKNLTKRYNDHAVVEGVDFEVKSGELVALLGPSGGGKSTLLRLLAGLETPDAGAVYIGNQEATHLEAKERGIGFVFQHYALFRHLTVERNVAFGLEVRQVSKAEALERARELLRLVGLEAYGKRYPAQLSGGQRQRVALARALAPKPRLLLLDEPFGAIDAKVREELRQWLRRLHEEVHVTTLFVTHDQDEAFSIADRVLVINQGRVEQHGSPEEILDHPATEFVARFVGEVNVMPSVVAGRQATSGELVTRLTEDQPAGPASLVVRSYDLKFWREDPGIATVQRVVTLGDRVRVQAQLDGAGTIMAQFPRRSSLLQGIAPGVRIQVEVTSARAYPSNEPRAHTA